MREILFRGRHTYGGGWVYGSLIVAENFCCILESEDDGSRYDFPYLGGEMGTIDGNAIPIIPETIGQYTGLTDKNGKMIFEGDIVTMPAYAGGKHKAVVYFKNGKFAVDGSNYHFKDIAPKRMEIIGNIHYNPELLKEGADND